MSATRRALHFVFKVADRKKTAAFYRDVLGMKVLRHEEFEEGCKATCNGPYDGKWSKTMIGYGAEDSHFVLELTYNYGVKHYERGNDFQRLTLHSKHSVENAHERGYPLESDSDDMIETRAPGGYPFRIHATSTSSDSDPVQSVTLSVSDLQRSVAYWTGLVGMKEYSREEKHAVLGFADNQCKLELQQVDKVERKDAFGRIAFSCPRAELPGIESAAREGNHTIINPLVSLDTPGKATVEVVILADPDGHEICFVGDEAFRELSQVDPSADHLLTKAIEEDKSVEWFAQRKAKHDV